MNIDEQGNVTEVTIFSAEPQRYFDRAVITALKTWKFAPEGEKYIAEVEINFKLPD
jgi:TonB family protein